MQSSNRCSEQADPATSCFSGRHERFVGMATAPGQRRVSNHRLRGRLQRGWQQFLVDSQLMHCEIYNQGSFFYDHQILV